MLANQYKNEVDNKNLKLRNERESALKEEKELLDRSFKNNISDLFNNIKYKRGAYNDLQNNWRNSMRKKQVKTHLIECIDY